MKKLYTTLLSVLAGFVGFSQTSVITGNASGGFENGPPFNFASNFWGSANGAFNQWAMGTGSVGAGTRGAYIGNGTTFAGTNDPAISHIYRSTAAAIPAGVNRIAVVFKYRQPVVDPGGDSLIMSVAVNAVPNPTAGNTVNPAYTRLYSNTATAYPGYVVIGPVDIPLAYAGQSIKLAFTHVNNGTGAIGVPAIDSVVMYHCNLAANTGTATLCPGTTTTLSNATGVGTWSSSNPAVATTLAGPAASTTVTGITAGTATITYSNGLCYQTTVVTVNPLPAAIGGVMTVCPGNTTLLSDTDPGGAWSNSPTSTATISAGGLVTAIATGTSTVTYTLPTGCRTTSVVTVHPLPVASNVTGGGSRCATGPGVSIGLDNTVPGVTYFLFNGASLVSSMAGTGAAANFPTLFTAAGTYTATATSTITGCSNNMSGSATVSIATPVVPSVTITLPTLICSGDLVTFTPVPVNGGVSPTYQWWVNGVATTMGSTYTYSPVNGDILAVTLHTGGICAIPDTAIASETLAVSTLVTPAVTIAVGPSNPSCEGSPVTFSATPTFGGPTPSFRWTRAGVNVATGPTYSCVPTNGDPVYCRMTSSYTCRTADTVLSSVITMTTVPSAAVPVVNILASPGTNVPDGTTVTLTAMVSGTTVPVAYQWHLNGTPIPGATDVSYTSNSFVAGDIITCKVTNVDPCAKSSLKSVSFGPTSAVGGIDIVDNAFSLSPNPNKGTFHLTGLLQEAGTMDLTVVNMLGQVIYSQSVVTPSAEVSQQINIGNVPAGVYLLNVRTGAASGLVRFTVSE
ncbi:MAG: T9SS type A sorting domain-containing protein [Taibaiella sp.]|nr:T9SS type A sorting domain-containing protein [Taibaiella sp.]